MIAPPMKANVQRVLVRDMRPLCGLEFQATVEPAGYEAADDGADRDEHDPVVQRVLIAAGHLQQVGHAVDVTRRDDILRDRLAARILAKGLMDLAQEEFQRMTRVEANEPSTLENQLWHVSGARDLTSRQAAILFELLKWRESKAKELKRPSFKVIDAETLLEIAFTQSSSSSSLILRAHLSERQVERFGPEIIHAVELGQKRPPMRCPANSKPDQVLRNRVDRLKEFRKSAAAEMKVESDIILPRDLLYQLAENPPSDWQDFEARMGLYPWRLEHFGEQIFKAIQPKQIAREA